MRFLRIFVFLFFSFMLQGSYATHIVGGELSYKVLANGLYEFELIVYKDCQPFLDSNGTTITPAGFDNIYGKPLVTPGAPFAKLNVLNDDNSLYQEVNFTSLTIENVNIESPDSCIELVGDFCIQKGTYKVTIPLPSSSNGYFVSYQRCCRNPSVNNIVANPFQTGSIFSTEIPPNNFTLGNSNPKFSELPPLEVCINQSLNYNCSAIDIDGDSLHYYLTTPQATSSNTAGNIDATPYPLIVYNVPYAPTHPLDASPPMWIDPETGIITGTPTQIGSYIIAVMVEEYRNGVLLSKTIRDFRMLVFDCKSHIADFEAFDNYCTGNQTVNFEAIVDDSLTLLWDFGDQNTTADTASGYQVTYNYPADGDYDVRLISSRGAACIDTIIKEITIKNEINFDLTGDSILCWKDKDLMSFEIVNQEFSGGAKIQWNFSQSDLDTVGPTQLNDIDFTTPGNHFVQVTIEDNNCKLSRKIPIFISDSIEFKFPNKIAQCNSSEVLIQLQDLNHPLHYEWYLDSVFHTNDPSFTIYTDHDTVLDLKLIYTDQWGCTDSIEEKSWITIFQNAEADFTISNTDIEIYEDFEITNLSNSFTFMEFFISDGTISNEESFTHQFTVPGDYFIAQNVNVNGKCPDKKIIHVKVRVNYSIHFPNAFTPSGDNLNEYFFPETYNIKAYTLEIFDRWGRKVYDGSQYQEKHQWDGRDQDGELLQEALFNYQCKYTTINGEILETSGFVMLL
ncbi:MAG: gliding motility-associated C-terminal domain-containing protein [Flavobacteriales bacterium]|jgi:gliding motility-associated-like protein|nr:gliding motility-associated C-terminal domain-containing protein [Flavobacteriales bacterium]